MDQFSPFYEKNNFCSSKTSSDRLKLIYKTKKMRKKIIMARLKPLCMPDGFPPQTIRHHLSFELGYVNTRVQPMFVCFQAPLAPPPPTHSTLNILMSIELFFSSNKYIGHFLGGRILTILSNCVAKAATMNDGF
jgi:hypothetical protein